MGTFDQQIAAMLVDVGPLALLERSGPSEPRINDYDPIAPAFDDVMGLDFHAATHDIRQRIAKEVANAGAIKCVDLCAGTGLFLEKLSANLNVQGWGLDLSRGQIDIAQSRAARRSAIRYAVGDVVTEQLPTETDLVTINFDALNHISGLTNWRAVLSKAHNALRPGGVLLFDVNLPERLAKDWDSPEVIVKERVTYIQLSHPCVWCGSAVRRKTPMIIFQRDNDGCFHRLDALIEQLALPLHEVLALLTAVGFRRTDVLLDGDALPRGHIFNKNRAFVATWK